MDSVNPALAVWAGCLIISVTAFRAFGLLLRWEPKRRINQVLATALLSIALPVAIVSGGVCLTMSAAYLYHASGLTTPPLLIAIWVFGAILSLVFIVYALLSFGLFVALGITLEQLAITTMRAQENFSTIKARALAIRSGGIAPTEYDFSVARHASANVRSRFNLDWKEVDEETDDDGSIASIKQCQICRMPIPHAALVCRHCTYPNLNHVEVPVL